jgi:pro-kumamolisin-like protein
MEAWLFSEPFHSNRIGWYRFGTTLLGRVALFSLLFTSSRLFAAETTVELSPLVAESTLLAPLDADKEIGVVLALPLSDPKGAADYIQHISRKGDPLYHHYLTPQQFADRFGGNAADYAALRQWATANSLKISQESIARTNLTVRGSAGQFEKIFHTQINRYRAPDGSEFYSASVKPTLPAAITTKISGVIGLTGGRQYAPLLKVAKRLGESPVTAVSGTNKANAAGTGPGGTYSAKDLRTAYSTPTFGNLGNNTVVALFEQGGFAASDVTEYFDTNDLPHVKVTPVSVDNSPTTISDYGVELEAVLDIDMVVGINPNVDEVRVYEDSIDTFQTALLDAITQVGDENKAQVLSISYGQDEGYQGKDAIAAENTALQQLAIEGITVTASSGDSGAYGDGYNSPYNVSDPASQPYVTGVGGTSLYTGVGHAYVVEEAWNDLLIGDGATGGGVSSYWPIPSYQSTGLPGGYMTANGGSATMRNVPDVAAIGDPLTGVGVYSKINGGWIEIGGTSVASPIWGGYLSIINAGFDYTGLQHLGFFNPALYGVGAAEYPFAQPSAYLFDIYVGSNGYPGTSDPGYSNGAGYSNTTGNGSLWGSGFATQLMISGIASGNAPSAIEGLTQAKTTNSSVTLKWGASKGAAGYVVGIYYTGDYTNIVETFITKTTSITVPDLVKGRQYWAYVWAFNSSGGSPTLANPLYFVPGSLYGGSGVEERLLAPAPDPINREAFGSTIGLSGKNLVIGEPLQTIGNNLYVGSAYVYVEPPQGWGSDQPAQVAQLTASDALSEVWPHVGAGVAISGDTIAVYANYKAYVFVEPAGGWTNATENARLIAPKGYSFEGTTTTFGYIAIDGDTIAACVVKNNDSHGQVSGAAIYVKPADGWTGDIQPVAVLTNGQIDDGLGQYIAISGDTIVQSARGAVVNGLGAAGAVYVYEKSAAGWTTTSTPTAMLVSSDPMQNGYVGYGVGLSGDTIVAGGPYTYVFVRKGAHWRSGTQTAKLNAPSVTSNVAIHGDMIVAGADGATPPDGAMFGGELYLYRKPIGGWRNLSKPDGVLYDPGAPPLFGLGVCVAVENGTIVGGASVNDGFGDTPGAVCIFRPQ